MKWVYNEFSQFCSRALDLVHLSARSSDHGNRNSNRIFGRLSSFVRTCIFSILSVGPLPNHIAFILDGNPKIKYVTIYAFSIDNFRRRPEEVKLVMELMQEKIEGLLREESLVMEYGVRVHFVGNLKLLSESVQSSVKRVIKASERNTKAVLVVCVAYTSTDEIVHSIEESFQERDEGKCHVMELGDIERHMYMDVAPDVDILVRSSGETWLSNFLLWQTGSCLLYSPSALWPELGIWHIVWSVLNFQRHYSYLEKKSKQA